MVVFSLIVVSLIYLIVTNVIIRKAIASNLLELDELEEDNFLIFILGIGLPIVLLYKVITEISIYLFNLSK